MANLNDLSWISGPNHILGELLTNEQKASLVKNPEIFRVISHACSSVLKSQIGTLMMHPDEVESSIYKTGERIFNEIYQNLLSIDGTFGSGDNEQMVEGLSRYFDESIYPMISNLHPDVINFLNDIDVKREILCILNPEVSEVKLS